jgi:hypothetical protein
MIKQRETTLCGGDVFDLQLRPYLEEMDTICNVLEHVTYVTRQNNTWLLNNFMFQLQWTIYHEGTIVDKPQSIALDKTTMCRTKRLIWKKEMKAPNWNLHVVYKVLFPTSEVNPCCMHNNIFFTNFHPKSCLKYQSPILFFMKILRKDNLLHSLWPLAKGLMDLSAIKFKGQIFMKILLFVKFIWNVQGINFLLTYLTCILYHFICM